MSGGQKEFCFLQSVLQTLILRGRKHTTITIFPLSSRVFLVLVSFGLLFSSLPFPSLPLLPLTVCLMCSSLSCFMSVWCMRGSSLLLSSHEKKEEEEEGESPVSWSPGSSWLRQSLDKKGNNRNSADIRRERRGSRQGHPKIFPWLFLISSFVWRTPLSKKWKWMQVSRGRPDRELGLESWDWSYRQQTLTKKNMWEKKKKRPLILFALNSGLYRRHLLRPWSVSSRCSFMQSLFMNTKEELRFFFRKPRSFANFFPDRLESRLVCLSDVSFKPSI